VREVITQLTTADRRLPPVQLFDECHTQVVEYLTAQHRVFITSDEFIDLWNEAENASPSIPSRSPSVASSRHDDDDDDQQQPIDMMLTPSSAPPLPPPRNSVHQPGPTLHPRRSTTRATHGKTTGALTKHALRDTQQDREQLLGKTYVDLRMHETFLYLKLKLFSICIYSEFERASHTNVKFPYVGAATTSKNDSAVSSAFSSEA
jgi:type IV secretory pathway VirB10-like protein